MIWHCPVYYHIARKLYKVETDAMKVIDSYWNYLSLICTQIWPQRPVLPKINWRLLLFLRQKIYGEFQQLMKNIISDLENKLTNFISLFSRSGIIFVMSCWNSPSIFWRKNNSSRQFIFGKTGLRSKILFKNVILITLYFAPIFYQINTEVEQYTQPHPHPGEG